MNGHELQSLIGRMVYPAVTVNSLTMFANKLYTKYGSGGLKEFLVVLCRQDVYKAALLSLRLTGEPGDMAEAYLAQYLTERCEHAEEFSYLDLLAVSVCKNGLLPPSVSEILTKEIIEKAMESADASTACRLLQFALRMLPVESCLWTQKAFCKSLATEYGEQMEKSLSGLLPDLLKYDAVDVLTALVDVAGAERLSGFYGEELTDELDRLIRSGKDNMSIWELFFCRFFRKEWSQEELLNEGLWYVQLHADDEIYEQVCAVFFLRVAACYGVDHPILAYKEDLSFTETYSWQYRQQYKDTIRPLWDNPKELSVFLDKTAAFNPFRQLQVLGKWYYLLHTAQDRIAYARLQSLFEADLAVNDILNIFFDTELKEGLPLEDLFYLAKRHEVLPELLEILRDRPFGGRVTGRYSRQLLLSPYSYYSTALHQIPITYKILESTGGVNQLKGQDLPYVITGYLDGEIQVAAYEAGELSDTIKNDIAPWETSIEQLRSKTKLQTLPEKILKTFAITRYSLEDVIAENHLDQFSRLIMDRPDCLKIFLKIMKHCKWNASFQRPLLILTPDLLSRTEVYQAEAVKMFRQLFELKTDIYSVLRLYFYSIYATVIPLEKFLLLAPREKILDQIPVFGISCRLLEDGASQCLLDNIRCNMTCSMDGADGITETEQIIAVITDYVVENDRITKITLQPYQRDTDGKERGSLFGNLASNIHIPDHLQERLEILPPATEYGYRELKFNVRCMEQAVSLRRSNATELKNLLRDLGEANPYAFGVCLATDFVYFRKPKEEEDVLNSITSMVLNAERPEDIRDFYLHTHIKYHLHLPQLAAMIQERRPNWKDHIPELFEGVTFMATADTQGNLWMPWVSQGSVQVPGNYAGKILSCDIRVEKTGAVYADIKAAEENDIFFQLVENCLLSGYRMDGYMSALVEFMEKTLPVEEKQLRLASVPFHEHFGNLCELVLEERFSNEDLSSAIRNMILRYGKISVSRMGYAVASLIKKWMKHHSDQEGLQVVLADICSCFDVQYPNNHLFSCITMMLDGSADAHEAPIVLTRPAKPVLSTKVQGEDSREKESFATACENLMKMPDGSYTLKKSVALLQQYKKTVSQENMEIAMLAQTEKWMKTQEVDDEVIKDLIFMHMDFIRWYKSGTLGLNICRQGYRYLKEDVADQLERGICKYTYKSFAGLPELVRMLPPYEEWLARLRKRIVDPAYGKSDTTKRICKLIRNYSIAIPMEEMKQTVLELLDHLMDEYANSRFLNQHIKQLHSTFEQNYGVSDLQGILWERVYQHQCNDIRCDLQLTTPMTAYAFANRIKILIARYKNQISVESMRGQILDMAEQWSGRISDESEILSAAREIYLCFTAVYDSDELKDGLCQLVCDHSGQSAKEELLHMLVEQEVQ